jgi:hypothetical protein
VGKKRDVVKGPWIESRHVADCAERITHAADSIGIRGIVVHAISEPAKAFYLDLGFEPSRLDPMTPPLTENKRRAGTGVSDSTMNVQHRAGGPGCRRTVSKKISRW